MNIGDVFDCGFGITAEVIELSGRGGLVKFSNGKMANVSRSDWQRGRFPLDCRYEGAVRDLGDGVRLIMHNVERGTRTGIVHAEYGDLKTANHSYKVHYFKDIRTDDILTELGCGKDTSLVLYNEVGSFISVSGLRCKFLGQLDGTAFISVNGSKSFPVGIEFINRGYIPVFLLRRALNDEVVIDDIKYKVNFYKTYITLEKDGKFINMNYCDAQALLKPRSFTDNSTNINSRSCHKAEIFVKRRERYLDRLMKSIPDVFSCYSYTCRVLSRDVNKYMLRLEYSSKNSGGTLDVSCMDIASKRRLHRTIKCDERKESFT